MERGLNGGKIYATNQIFDSKKLLINKLTITFGNKVQIVRPLKRNESSLIFPSAKNVLTSLNDKKNNLNESTEMTQSDLSKIHDIATQIKSEISSIQFPNNILRLNVEDAKNIIPNNLYILIMLLISDDPKINKDNHCMSI